MTSQDWNEINLSETPAIELLKALGYIHVPPEELEKDRESLKSPFLIGRLGCKLKEINPWLSDDGVKKALRAITTVAATSLLEANEKVHTMLVHGYSVEEDQGTGKKGQNVRFIDFESVDRNEFIVTRQLKVVGPKTPIIPDIVLFINGIPVAVIECKSPTIKDPIQKAVEQLFRDQEFKEEYKGRGAPRLFEPVQILAGICQQAAKYGTTYTPYQNFYDWKVPYPLTLDELNSKYTSKLSGKPPTAQDILLCGIFERGNLLDIIRNFIAFEVENGRVKKKICRYQQFVAVNNALQKILSAKDPQKRGGVIWHTQGSGKSLSMLWLAVKLKHYPKFDNPLLVIVTDRVDLDSQIKGTFERCGFPNPLAPDSGRELSKLISDGQGQTVLTTIQKFQELEAGAFLTDSENVFVMVDEAHRTQYNKIAAIMRQAMPNACFIGFTGTPIDKKDRSTMRTFGQYIHTYTIEQAVQDGATVPIYYESRLPDIQIQGSNLDELFDRYFSEYTEEQRAKIKQKYATEDAIALASSRIETICLDIIKHYEQFILPNGFKAQIVVNSREAAVLYKETLDRLNAPASAVIMSQSNNDPERLAKHHHSQAETKELIRSFKEDSSDKLAILIVCDKLITGFDAPIEQVMYLDRPLKEHTLLQAIARVNRTAHKKTYGLIVDYWGVSKELQDALGIFNETDIIGAMLPKNEELPRLEARHRTAMQFFDKADKTDIEACLKVITPPDIRADFELAFRRFSESMDMVLPDPAALRYSPDLKWLGKLRNAARARFRDAALDLAVCGAKVRDLIEEHIKTTGIQKILEPVSIFSSKFDDVVAALNSDEAKASEMEHAIRHEIHVHIAENPVFYQSLREKLEQIIEERRRERLDAVQALKHLQGLVDELRGIGDKAKDIGLNETEYALYEMLSSEGKGAGATREASPGFGDSAQAVDLKGLTQKIISEVGGLAVIDWIHKEDIQREMRKKIKGVLRDSNYEFEEIEEMTPKIMDLARARLQK